MNQMITSAQNSQIKQVRALLNKRQERESQKLYVVEGVRLMEEAVAAGVSPQVVLYSNALSARGAKLLNQIRSSGVQTEEVAPELLKSLSDTETPQGILAVLPIHGCRLPDQADFVVLADQVRDPGNLGTLLRTGLAAGVQAIILTPGTVDAFSPKTVRSAMGAHFRLPLVNASWEELADWHAAQKPRPNFWVSDVREGVPCWDADLRSPLMLGIGGEAEGISSAAFTLPHHKVHIPMPGKSESLNASIAAGILVFEVLRQRSITA